MYLDKSYVKKGLEKIIDELNNIYDYADSALMDAYDNDDDDARFYIEDIVDKINNSLDMAYQAHALI